MEEIWKDIKGYEGYYQASNLGNIKSLLFQNNVYKKKYKREKILKQKIIASTRSKNRKDCRVELWKNGEHKTFLVARLVAFTFYGVDLKSKLTVNHKDGNSLNNNIENLEIISLSDNIKYGFANGQYPAIKNILSNNNQKFIFKSLSETSRFLNRNSNYCSCILKKGKNIVVSKSGEKYKIEIKE